MRKSTTQLACTLAALSTIGILAAITLLPGCARSKPVTAFSQPLPSFSVTETFGVSHPDQIIDFDLPPGVPTRDVHVVDGAENPVPFQFVEDGSKLAVRTDLPAGGSRRWALRQEAPEVEFEDALQITETDETIEIASDLLAVRLPNFSASDVPLASSWADAQVPPFVDLFNYGPESASQPRQVLLAPVQGVRLHDGTWSGLGPNMLVVLAKDTTGVDVRFLERGPLRAVVQINYRFDKPAYGYGHIKISKPGPGYYSCTITVEAGQPSILFEENTDLEMVWGMNLYAGVEPDQARYRGHHSRSVKAGRGPNGAQYKGYQTGDATVDLQYQRPQTPSYGSTDSSWRYLSVWDPWAFDTGWYWQAFNSAAEDTANAVGLFAGRASRAIGAAMGGAGIFTLPQDPRQAESSPVFGVAVQSYRRAPDNRMFPRSRFEWGLYLGSKADVLPPDQVQPINRQMNIHGGINLNKVHRWTLDFPDPPNGYGGAFMPVAAVEAVKNRARENDQYFKWLYNADPYSRPLFDAWRNPDEKRDAAVAQVVTAARDMLEALVNKGGIYEMSVHYWHGGLTAQRYGVWIDQLLAEPDLPAEQQEQLKAAAVMFANVVWDDDHAPISSNVHGLNLGTENMPIQQWGYRRFYALFMARHPTMTERTKQVVNHLKATVDQQINDHGAHIGCPHYIGASFAPTLNTLLQVKQLGKVDPFDEWPKLAQFADFYMNLLTPPEPRVGDKRCFISLGDGGTEPSEIYGVLGTGFRDADPALSAKLMGAWEAGGKPHSFFFGSTVFMIDDRLPSADPALADATFPGYYSVLRHAWGTPAETALWVVNGDHYRDHRSHDQGSLVLYALGKPLSVDWSAIYTPHTPGAYLRSTVVPETAIGHPWDQNGASLSSSQIWAQSRQASFESNSERADAVALFQREDLAWQRATTIDRSDPEKPVILIRDTFDGDNAAVPKVASFTLMAVGPVQTPQGEVMPPLHTHPNAGARADAPPSDLPSATSPMTLSAGIHRFGFTGRYDVDFDVYVVADQPVQALLGSWAVNAWGGHVTEREERQHILRVRGTGDFTTLIVPWRKGQKPEELAVVADGAAVAVTAGGKAIRFDLNNRNN